MRIGLVLGTASAALTQCASKVRLWIHQDVTASFGTLLKRGDFLQTVINSVRDLSKDFDFGLSAFSDRDGNSEFCYKDIVPFGGDFAQKVRSADTALASLPHTGGGTPGEDSLSGLPFIAANKFADPDALNILAVITDDFGKYEELLEDWPSRYAALDYRGSREISNPQAEIVCDADYMYLTRDQIFAPLREHKIVPLFFSSSNGAPLGITGMYTKLLKAAGYKVASDAYSGEYYTISTLPRQLRSEIFYLICPKVMSKAVSIGAAVGSFAALMLGYGVWEYCKPRNVEASAEVITSRERAFDE